MGDLDFATRRRSVAVDVGGVVIGGGRPIVVQSMTNTDTADADATAIQVARLAHAGSELVRVTVNTEAAAAAVPEIVRKVHGLEIAQILLGHAKADVTQIYAERDMNRAVEVARKIG